MIRVALSEIERVAPERQEGYLEEIMAAGELQDGYVVLKEAVYDRLLRKFSGEVRPCGVGCFIKRGLASIGIEATGECPCNAHAAVCDAWGPDVCLRRLPEIVGWLRTEAAVRGLLFNDFAAFQLVRIACWRAKKHARKVAAGRT